ncbi:MAG: formylmethanofuran dehydrogenase subunit A [Planctomycetota bacterium]
MLTKITGGFIYDPANGVHGEVRDLWIREGKLIDAPDQQAMTADRVIQADGVVVMPGGVDMHCHIAGGKVNAARRLNPELAQDSAPWRRRDFGRSGTGLPVPSTFTTGYRYLGLGYTVACDAAVAPSQARHAHLEFADIPCIDKAMFILSADHRLFLQALSDGDPGLAKDVLGALLYSSGGYALKLVNPGGVEAWKSGDEIRGLDQRVPGFAVTPRDILRETAVAAEVLQLPHPPHIHCNGLGMPGNWQTTLATMQALEGHRGHFAHIQFHSYDGGDADESTFGSKVAPLVDYFNEHPNISVDVGQVLFGETVSMTADGAASHYLSRLRGRKWQAKHLELESGCGITPITYRRRNVVNAWQWTIGLEWFLSVNDLWRLALSTDHPNGGCFVAYPELIRLLMDAAYRREVLSQLPEVVRERTPIASTDRELSLTEIAIITRAAPARLLGMQTKGHLGAGADADITGYVPDENKATMFGLPRFVMKSGELLIENGELRRDLPGTTLITDPSYDAEIESYVDLWFSKQMDVPRRAMAWR